MRKAQVDSWQLIVILRLLSLCSWIKIFKTYTVETSWRLRLPLDSLKVRLKIFLRAFTQLNCLIYHNLARFWFFDLESLQMLLLIFGIKPTEH